MARKIKIDNAILKRYSKSEEKRKTAFRNKRSFYLIVCEGEKTEPNYFESLKESLPKGVLELANIDICGTGKNTLSIIDESIKLKQGYEDKYMRTIDHVWAVFDKDSFPARNFNNAINKGENSKPKVNCAWTNEAFELWYLLHFNYYNTGVTRDQYKKLLEQEIDKANGTKGFEYKKNSKEMYKLLCSLGNQDQAISNAEKLETLHFDQKFSDHNPCTKVHKLVKELNELANEFAIEKST